MALAAWRSCPERMGSSRLAALEELPAVVVKMATVIACCSTAVFPSCLCLWRDQLGFRVFITEEQMENFFCQENCFKTIDL